jgi:hypothetical protein
LDALFGEDPIANIRFGTSKIARARNMAGYWFLVVTVVAIVFIFKNGVAFALCFFGTTAIPCVAIAGAKWGLVSGDSQQKFGVPLVAVLLLGFSYWLSTSVSLHLLGLDVSGLTLVIISGVIGLIGVPTSWGSSSINSN